MRKTDFPVPDNPLDAYFSALLGNEQSAIGNVVNWDDLLQSAVQRHVSGAELSASTLAPGFAPILSHAPGAGSAVVQFTQLLDMLGLLTQLPPGRLRNHMLECCSTLQRGGGYG